MVIYLHGQGGSLKQVGMKTFGRNHRLMTPGTVRFLLLAVVLMMYIPGELSAQYFGRTKPGYKKFDYSVLQTPHFEIYHYLKNDSLLNTLVNWSENWYNIHRRTFSDTLRFKNPLIFYNNHSDFQQTNTISGLIGAGTGGVTESLKNRVIMPVAPTLSQTDHTLGHELVHAFQYNLFLHSDSSKLYSLRNLPLWMVEGMAEYLSIGSEDPNTAMWMRDALVNDDFPTIKKLSDESKYFPYRYGQAFWAMVAKTWGDSVVMPLFKSTARLGFDAAADSVLGFNENTLSGMWKSAMELHFRPYLKNDADSLTGRMIISKVNGGKVNVSPAVSPDGKYITFYSEKSLFTLDLFLADAGTGKIIKKLSSIARNTDIDDFNFIESTGTWSPDSRKFAFVIFTKGINKIAIVDVARENKIREIEIKGVPAIFNPSWSPDGNRIVFTGTVNGISDLYVYDLETGITDRLTNDMQSNIHPSWSADGRYLVFAQEIINSEPGIRRFSYDIAIMDMKTRNIRRLNVFNGAWNLNPGFSKDDNSVYFLSDADGFRNLYEYNLTDGTVKKLTEYMTGISGITPFSPAISMARQKGTVVYNYYINNGYQIWVADENEFRGAIVDKNIVNFEPGTLPPVGMKTPNRVDRVLSQRQVMGMKPDTVREVPYKPKFKLDYISNNASIGIATGMYRNNSGGSINMIFSDILGNSQLYSSLSLNGEIFDFGGQTAYINQKSKLKWGGAVSHIPYRAGSMYLTYDSLDYADTKILVQNLILDYMRMFEDNITGFAYYPLSQNRRFEGGFSMSWYYYRIERYNNYYTLDGIGLGSKRQKLDAPPGGNYQQVSLAYVEDNSYFAMTSPFQGHRLRYEVQKYFGQVDFFTALLDYRKYFYMKPVSFAIRAYHFGRYGGTSTPGIISPLYIGYPWMVRGYENVSPRSDTELMMNSFDISRLTGQRTIVANAELRIPFTGPEKLALIKSRLLLTDLNFFLDGGLAWSPGDKITLEWNPLNPPAEKRYPVYSTGVSIRINVLGALILEPYYAFPFQNGGFKNGVFGLNFTPGW